MKVAFLLAALALPLVEGYTLWRVWSTLIVPYIDGAPVLGAIPFTGLVLIVGVLQYDYDDDSENRSASRLFLRYFTCVLTQITVAVFSVMIGS